MSQHDMDVANQPFPAFRADMNLALAALVQNSSGATEPATMFAYQFWADTTTGIIKQRNAANTAWISLFTMSTGALIGNAATATTALNITNTSGQIPFPVTQIPSSDPNTLDDYEEGTFIPTVLGSASYISQSGVYTKVGRMVTASLRMHINILGTGSGYRIDGLPFAAASGIYPVGSVAWGNVSTTIVSCSARVVGDGSQSIDLLSSASAGLSQSASPILGNNCTVDVTVSYTTA